ncbi:MAG: hypothetical protein HQL51_12905 [Magnetococcales bacterium]|nr:hypothetical protein [Magnetococcales bacterium]
MLVFRPRRAGLIPALALTLALSGCASQTTGARSDAPSPPANDMFFDALLCRPLGLVSTVVGTSLFVISLPFSALGGNSEQAAERLVMEPYRFTFQRPLGDPRCPGFSGRQRIDW